MGSLTLPASGLVYLDTNSFIYTVERIDPYRAILDVFWQEIRAGSVVVITSELTVMEVLIKPLKQSDNVLEAVFRTALLQSPDVRLLPVSLSVLEHAAQLRATTNLKTPDAIHAATALEAGVALFITNDRAFQHIPGLSVTILDDALTP